MQFREVYDLVGEIKAHINAMILQGTHNWQQALMATEKLDLLGKMLQSTQDEIAQRKAEEKEAAHE